MSSVKVYPYIDNTPEALLQEKATAKSSSSQNAEAPSFKKMLAEADRTQQAMAVDSLIAVSRTGSVDIETVRKLLGFNPSPSGIVAGAALTSSVGSATSPSANTKAAASTAAGTSGSSDSLSCPAELEGYFEEAAETYNVDIDLLKAIAKAESNFTPSATSSAGAMGVMQLMPSTAASLGITDAYDPRENIMGGAKIISQHLEKYDGDLSLALAAYNAGSGNVDKYGGIPPFEETQNYVKKVLNYYENA